MEKISPCFSIFWWGKICWQQNKFSSWIHLGADIRQLRSHNLVRVLGINRSPRVADSMVGSSKSVNTQQPEHQTSPKYAVPTSWMQSRASTYDNFLIRCYIYTGSQWRTSRRIDVTWSNFPVYQQRVSTSLAAVFKIIRSRWTLFRDRTQLQYNRCGYSNQFCGKRAPGVEGHRLSDAAKRSWNRQPRTCYSREPSLSALRRWSHHDEIAKVSSRRSSCCRLPIQANYVFIAFSFSLIQDFLISDTQANKRAGSGLTTRCSRQSAYTYRFGFQVHIGEFQLRMRRPCV